MQTILNEGPSISPHVFDDSEQVRKSSYYWVIIYPNIQINANVLSWVWNIPSKHCTQFKQIIYSFLPFPGVVNDVVIEYTKPINHDNRQKTFYCFGCGDDRENQMFNTCGLCKNIYCDDCIIFNNINNKECFCAEVDSICYKHSKLSLYCKDCDNWHYGSFYCSLEKSWKC